MNENVIIPIVENSFKYAYQKFKEFDLDVDKNDAIFIGMVLEQLAQGVVEECLQVINSIKDTNEKNTTIKKVSQKVKKHFNS